jgi:hypothetical protein
MRRAYWRLKYDPEVGAKLYQMRERGIAVRAAIKELSFQREPWIGSFIVHVPRPQPQEQTLDEFLAAQFGDEATTNDPDVIYAYTRDMAIADGQQIDVTETAGTTGLYLPRNQEPTIQKARFAPVRPGSAAA